ncbi:hypothetical protein A2U01_0073108, partial [Trifolium medium]|nr:hypothetical protein [Trifolium medium]
YAGSRHRHSHAPATTDARMCARKTENEED